jgi:hypothetical protein
MQDHSLVHMQLVERARLRSPEQSRPMPVTELLTGLPEQALHQFQLTHPASCVAAWYDTKSCGRLSHRHA